MFRMLRVRNCGCAASAGLLAACGASTNLNSNVGGVDFVGGSHPAVRYPAGTTYQDIGGGVDVCQ